MGDKRERLYIAAVITAVWAFTVCAGTITGEYLGAQIATPVMLLMGGYYFGAEIADRLRGRANGNGKNGNGAK